MSLKTQPINSIDDDDDDGFKCTCLRVYFIYYISVILPIEHTNKNLNYIGTTEENQ